jgi:hypothetical protein
MAENSIQSNDVNIAKGVVHPVGIKDFLGNSSSHLVFLQ